MENAAMIVLMRIMEMLMRTMLGKMIMRIIMRMISMKEAADGESDNSMVVLLSDIVAPHDSWLQGFTIQ